MCGKKALWSTARMLSIQFSDYYMKLNKAAKEGYLSEPGGVGHVHVRWKYS